MIKGALIDVDGTLLHSNGAHAASWVEIMRKFNYKVEYDDVIKLIGMGGDKLLPSLVPSLDAESREGKEISNQRRKLFLKKHAPNLVPTRGARDMVLKLKDLGIDLIVASSASEEELSTLLKKAQVKDLLTQHTTSSDVEESKPAPDIVSVALKKLEIEPKDAIMIGDTPYDIEAAKKCGVRVIALKCGGFPEEKLKGAYAIYADPADLLNHLQEIV